MAKAINSKNDDVEVQFTRTGNAWIDAGIVGLYRLIRGTDECSSYLGVTSKKTKEPLTSLKEFKNVTVNFGDSALTLIGPKEELENFFDRVYGRLIECYFSLSSAKQRADKKAYNFYYETASETFKKFPKAKPAGAALLLFDKAARPTGDQIKWKDKQAPGILPAKKEYAQIQKKLDKFLSENELKPGPPAGMLVDGGNQVRPKLLKIKLDGISSENSCYLCGDSVLGLGNAKQTAFPLLGGSRCFENDGKGNPKIGWKIDFVGKFTPAVCFFMQQNDDLHLFLPVATSLTTMNKIASELAIAMRDPQENFYRNFNDNLGGFFERRSEVAIAFFHRTFLKLAEKNTELSIPPATETEAKSPSRLEPWDDDDDQDKSEEALQIDAEQLTRRVMTEGAVSFAIISASKKGNVWMPKSFWNYTDIVYLARLFQRMLAHVERTDQDGKIVRKVACSPKAFFNSLVDFTAKKDKTLLRDKVCDAILNKRTVLPLIEKHAFHINRDSNSINTRVEPLLKFISIYEPERYKETDMEETFRQMVTAATWLGRNIGKSVADAVKKDKRESVGRAKGAIHRLRKTRTVESFIDELARLQLRYGIDVPKDVLDGTQLSPETFQKFRGFCVVAALNRFLYALKPQQNDTSKGN